MQGHNLITLHLSPVLHYWTGKGNLVLGGNTYLGVGQALSISETEYRTGSPDKRLTISLGVIPPLMRAKFLQDVGPILVEVNWILRSGPGASWSILTPVYRGRLSNPEMAGGVLKVQLETLRGDVEKGRPLRWSHEDQQTRSGDRGMEYMRSLAGKGVETTWPP